MNNIAVIGLGYVGLPVALAIAKKFPNTVGFDINQEKITALNQGIDFTGEVTSDELKNTSLNITCDPIDLADCNFYLALCPTTPTRYLTRLQSDQTLSWGWIETEQGRDFVEVTISSLAKKSLAARKGIHT